uniref:BED-type domain-containing protein n=1 Tax=Cacopsylla melanoneura TaxID=428564 RepID=A0A8D8TTF0_9HEMI
MGRKKNELIRSAYNIETFENGRLTHVCKSCQKSIEGSYITNLQRHLESRHQYLYKKLLQDEFELESPSPSKKVKIFLSFFSFFFDFLNLSRVLGTSWTFFYLILPGLLICTNSF